MEIEHQQLIYNQQDSDSQQPNRVYFETHFQQPLGVDTSFPSISGLLPSSNTNNYQEDNSNDSIALSEEVQNYFRKRKIILPNKSIYDISNIIHNYSANDMYLFGAVSVSSNGIVRLCSVFNNLNMGYFSSKCQQIEYLKSSQIVNLHFHPGMLCQKHSMIDALVFVAQSPHFLKIFELLNNLHQSELKVKKELKQITLTDSLVTKKNNDFEAFNEYCFEYLKEYSQKCQEGNQTDNEYEGNGNFNADNNFTNMDNKIFSYGIGRVSMEQADFETYNAGYSMGLLDLLGIDEDNLARIYLRNQKIDLIPNKQELMEQSMFGLCEKINRNYKNPRVFTITTIDGFPIKVNQTIKKIPKPERFKSELESHQEYLFFINVLDVDLESLQGLINYRESIKSTGQQQTSQIDIDRFIQKELSFKFEDIEYSIQSEEFLNKYYSENIKRLKQLEKRKQPCGYRLIV